MRLINTKDYSLIEVANEDEVPYGILSHCWGDEEYLFSDAINGTGRDKKGFQKVINLCAVARKESLQYVWIDTCCIDKTSSSELSEAINSMYRCHRASQGFFSPSLSFCGGSTILYSLDLDDGMKRRSNSLLGQFASRDEG